MFFLEISYNKATGQTVRTIGPAVKKRTDPIDIDRLVRGDQRQWKQFVSDVSPMVYSVLNKTLSDAGYTTKDASDLLQDVFVKLCRRHFQLLKKYDPDRSRLSTWVAVIARNIAIDHLRRHRPVTLSMDDIPEKKSTAPPEPKLAGIPFDLLPPRQMLIMKLIYERDLTVREVAGLMGIKEQTVRSARHKAISTLRRYLEKNKKRDV
jgi:RNA polymerase sigma-70 factor (ECF subfamily)